MAGVSLNLCYLGKPPSASAVKKSMKSPLMAVSSSILSQGNRLVVSPIGAVHKKYSSSLQAMGLKNRSSTTTSSLADTPIPIYVMLPLGIIAWNDKENKSELMDKSTLEYQLSQLKDKGVDGVMVDCWWGLVERSAEDYQWEGYSQLFELVKTKGLKLQIVMSFHSCGGNVGDDVNIPLPKWVCDIGDKISANIYFMDEQGRVNKECLSWGIDDKAVLDGRTLSSHILLYYLNPLKM